MSATFRVLTGLHLRIQGEKKTEHTKYSLLKIQYCD